MCNVGRIELTDFDGKKTSFSGGGVWPQKWVAGGEPKSAVILPALPDLVEFFDFDLPKIRFANWIEFKPIRVTHRTSSDVHKDRTAGSTKNQVREQVRDARACFLQKLCKRMQDWIQGFNPSCR